VLVASGAVLVIATWACCLLACVIAGLPVAALLTRSRLGWSDLRRGMWWGLLLLTVVTLAINLVAPLASAQAGLLIAGTLAICLAAGALMARRRDLDLGWTWSTGSTVVIATVGLAVGYLAVAALGPVTNYDSGLYHLGAIQYAAQYPTMPGLANLFFPLGYGTAEFPLAALLGNGPWGGEGYRLLNGLVIAMVGVDLVIRSRNPRCGPGFPVLLVGTAALLVPMTALSDYWVTSPSQDSAVFAVTVAASACVAQAVSGRGGWRAEATIGIGLAILLVLLRSPMAVYAGGVLLVAVALLIRAGAMAMNRSTRPALVVCSLGLLAGAFATIRDIRLSGWLQYPLSILAFDVPWRAADPVWNRTATLGYHRDPANLWKAAEDWNWIGPWLGRLPQQWETYLVLALMAAAALILAVAARGRPPLRWRAMLAATAPSAVMVVAWWALTPPSFRFAWGPVVTALSVPTGWGLWRYWRPGQDRRRGSAWFTAALAAFAAPVCLVVAFSATARLDLSQIVESRYWRWGVSIPYSVAAVTEPGTTSQSLPSGLVIQLPSTGEQCWLAFPLCTPQPGDGLRLRGPGLADGLASDAISMPTVEPGIG